MLSRNCVDASVCFLSSIRTRPDRIQLTLIDALMHDRTVPNRGFVAWLRLADDPELMDRDPVRVVDAEQGYDHATYTGKLPVSTINPAHGAAALPSVARFPFGIAASDRAEADSVALLPELHDAELLECAGAREDQLRLQAGFLARFGMYRGA